MIDKLGSIDSNQGRSDSERGNDTIRSQAGSLSEIVAGTVGRRIVSGHYEPGETLPTEPKIQEEFGVSRTAVREAFRLLSAKGLTISRPKIGTRVRPKSDWSMLDSDVLRWQVDQDPNDDFINALFEMREILEPAAAAHAADRATGEEMARLGAAMDGIQNEARGTPEQVKCDIAFHMTLLDASHNPLLRSVGAMIQSALEITFSLGWRTAMHDDTVVQHRAIYNAVRDRDRERAFYEMRRLLRISKGDLFDALYLARNGDEPPI